MAKRFDGLYDQDAPRDPFLAEYKSARDLLKTANWKDGLDQMESLAARGSTMSTLHVADAMRTGWGYARNLARAEDWYRAAAESGSTRGLFSLGVTHLLMDRHNEAIQELEAAVAKNYPPALNTLAGIHFRGDGVPVDRGRALSLWRKGIALGHLPSKRNLVQQALWGKFGPRLFFWALLNLFPVASESVELKEREPYSDRLR